MDQCASNMREVAQELGDEGEVARLNGLARFESEIGLYAPLEESSSQDVVESDPGVPTPHIVSGNAQNLRPSKSWRPPPEAEASTSSLPLPRISWWNRAVNRTKRWFSGTRSKMRLG